MVHSYIDENFVFM